MKRTRWTSLAIVAFSGLSLVSCSSDSVSRISAPSASSEPSFDVHGADKHQEVTGGVGFLLPEGPGTLTNVHYEMAAIRDRDGDVKGQVEIQVERATRQIFHGEIVCFSIVGNAAFLAARVTHSNVAFAPPGTYLAWTVVDNGEGRKSPPDLTSNFFLVQQALAMLHCQSGIPVPLYPVTNGNIQVH